MLLSISKRLINHLFARYWVIKKNENDRPKEPTDRRHITILQFSKQIIESQLQDRYLMKIKILDGFYYLLISKVALKFKLIVGRSDLFYMIKLVFSIF